MKEFKGTKGEWRVKYGNTDVYCDSDLLLLTAYQQNGYLKDINGVRVDCDEAIANAKLAAASKELLKAAIKALNDCCDLIGTEAGNSLEKAINKALN
tara:strand:- start:435 stop:725 length:291 start_codon:yes stop_codon:yes gene_type:complete